METLNSTHMLLLAGLFAAVFGGVVALMWWLAPRDLQRRIDRENLAEIQMDVGALEALKSGQLERELVFPRRQRGKGIRTRGFGNNRARPDAPAILVALAGSLG